MTPRSAGTRCPLSRFALLSSLLLFPLAAPAPAAAQAGGAGSWTVESPGGAVAVTVRRDAAGSLSYEVARGSGASRSVALASSPLGIAREDAAFGRGLRVTGENRRVVDETYTLLHGKASHPHARARELTLALAAPGGARAELVVRAYDEGAAFRYRFPDRDTTLRRVRGEATGFRLPSGTKGWMMPYDRPGQYTPAYENTFRPVDAGTASPTQVGWAFPALFRTPGGSWVLLTEAGLDGHYAGTHLVWDAIDGVYRIHFPDVGEGQGVGDVYPVSRLPWETPWRVVMVAGSLAGIAESSLVSHLAPPPAARDWSFVKPGTAAWSWWSDSDSPRNPAALRRFADLAAAMGWEYSLIDANWNLMPKDTVEALVRYATSKGVGTLLWYNSGGPHNRVTEQPRDRLDRRDRRRQEFAWLHGLGVKGVKIDFWQSDKQDRIQQYLDVLSDAADFQLMVDTHGSTLPRGWSRTWPNLMSMEAVQGAEQYKFNRGYPALAPAHNVMLAFTRNVVGPMDYTPVTFSDVDNPHRTTNAHELALSVVFESGLQHFADRPESYLSLPAGPKDFLRTVPAIWDETRLLDGDPDTHAVFARRTGSDWYVGGISGQSTARRQNVALTFLPAGSYSMLLVRDGADPHAFASEERTVRSGETIPVDLLPRGGFVMRLRPAGGVR
jgi:hypothetical protein